MPISVLHRQNALHDPGATISITLSTSPTPKSCLALAFMVDAGVATVSSISQAGATWTLAKRQTHADAQVEIWTAPSVPHGTASAITVTMSGSCEGAWCYTELAGVIRDGNHVNVTKSATGSSAGVSSGSFSVSVANAYVLAVVGWDDESLQLVGTSGASMTQSRGGGGSAPLREMGMLEKALTAAASTTINGSLNGSDAWAIAAIALAPEPEESTVPTIYLDPERRQWFADLDGRMTFYKDEDSVLDYTIDWSRVLSSGESIDTSEWEIDSGAAVIDSDSSTLTTTTVWVSKTSGVIKNTIVTDADRTHVRRIQFIAKAL